VDAVTQDLPNKVYLELTTDCNLDCAMCIRHSWDSRGGSMSDETFAAVLAGVKNMKSITTVSLSGFGAGLYVETITNGLLLDRAAARRLIDMKLDRIIVSIDSMKGASSEMLHAASFQTVSANLKALNEMRKSLNLKTPEIALEFVATKSNIHELPNLKQLSWMLGFSTILVTNVIPHTPELADQTLYKHWNTASRTRSASPWSVAVDMPVMDPTPEVADAQRLALVGRRRHARHGPDAGGGANHPAPEQRRGKGLRQRRRGRRRRAAMPVRHRGPIRRPLGRPGLPMPPTDARTHVSLSRAGQARRAIPFR